MAQWDENKSTTYSPNLNGNGHAAAMTDENPIQLQELMENARAEVDRYVETAGDFIRERPVACVAGALALGFIVGKIASRK